MAKFDDVPVEEDTKIIFQIETKLGQFDILYETWFWEGITAESIIFAKEDVSGLDDNEILKEVKKSPLLKKDSKITLQHSKAGFVFVNFNFDTE